MVLMEYVGPDLPALTGEIECNSITRIATRVHTAAWRGELWSKVGDGVKG